MTVSADIVVIGGGPGGVTAAVTAARLGKKVALIAARPVLGGNASSEVRIWARGATGGGNLFSEEFGVWGDFKMRNLFANPKFNPLFWDDVLLEHVKKEKNISLYLNTYVSEVELNKDKSIKSVYGVQQMSEGKFCFEGKMFIDATGDGTVGALANVPFVHGKESRETYGESFAPETHQKETLGSTVTFYTKKLEKPVKFTPPEYAYDMEHIEGILGQGGRIVHEEYSASDYWWFEYGGSINTIADNEEISFEIRRLVYGIWNYIKNSGKFSAEHLTLEWLGSIPGKRESRRMITEHVLTQNDVIEQKEFSDGGFYGGWFIDFHPAGGIYTDADNARQIPVQVYEIPMTTLYNKAVGNLLFAGRDIGTSHVAFASSRIMNTCALSGQAAATLAAECINQDLTLGAVNQEVFDRVRKQLDKDDMWLLSYNTIDETDKALRARVSVSSVVEGIRDEKTGSYLLDNGGFIVYPRDNKAYAKILFKAEKDSELRAKVYTTTVPSRYLLGTEVGSITLNIPKGESWVEIPISIEVEAGLVSIEFEDCHGVEIGTTNKELTGVVGGNKKEFEYFYPCIQLGTNKFYNQDALGNNHNRLYKQPNLWIGKTEQEEVAYSWDSPQTIEEIRLYFNPDLSGEIPSSRVEKWAKGHMFVAREGVPSQLVKDFSLVYKNGEKWEVIGEYKDNWKRMKKIVLDKPIVTDEVKVIIHSTYGSEAQLFQVRMY